jgi:2,3-diketo-5-methylthio-1-phosphopentane phosphatase
MTPTLFLDFDGTISRRDAVDVILETYADPAWLRIEDDWKADRLGSRECLSGQIALVRATRAEMDALLDAIDIDDGLFPLLEACARYDVRAHIVSDGFDYCINRILGNASPGAARLLRDVGVCASHMEPHGREEWRAGFPFFPQPCAHGCATCKPAAMRLLSASSGPVVFVGDGLSDRYAAASADVVFAKTGLAAYCLAQDIAYVPYADLCDVAACLELALRTGADVGPGLQTRASGHGRM